MLVVTAPVRGFILYSTDGAGGPKKLAPPLIVSNSTERLLEAVPSAWDEVVDGQI